MTIDKSAGYADTEAFLKRRMKDADAVESTMVQVGMCVKHHIR